MDGIIYSPDNLQNLNVSPDCATADVIDCMMYSVHTSVLHQSCAALTCSFVFCSTMGGGDRNTDRMRTLPCMMRAPCMNCYFATLCT
jgi:hypothetical protein